jgi:hypothetical protein
MAHQTSPNSRSGLSPSVAEKRILGLFSVRTPDAHGPGTRHLYLSRGTGPPTRTDLRFLARRDALYHQ